LCVDQIDVCIHIIVLQSLDSVTFGLVSEVQLLSFFLFQMRLGEVGILLHLILPFLVEFNEVFLMLQDLLQELFPARPASNLLTWAHLLLEPFNGFGFLLRGCEDTSAFVKLTVTQLMLVQIVTAGLGKQLLVCLVCLSEVFQDSLAHDLL
jgi:hypothetical protein